MQAPPLPRLQLSGIQDAAAIQEMLMKKNGARQHRRPPPIAVTAQEQLPTYESNTFSGHLGAKNGPNASKNTKKCDAAPQARDAPDLKELCNQVQRLQAAFDTQERLKTTLKNNEQIQ